MNGQVSIEIGNPGKEKEVPTFVGGGSTVNAALAGGTCMLQVYIDKKPHYFCKSKYEPDFCYSIY